MNVTLINSFLEHHPYYSKLTDFQKLTVLNVALTKYYEWKEAEIVHTEMADGHIGVDDTIIENDVIVRIPQHMISAKSLSKYSELTVNLSDTEFIKEFTEEERTILFQIALDKIAKLIPEEYSIETMTGDIILSRYTDAITVNIDYELDALIIKSLYAYMENAEGGYTITGTEEYKAFIDLPVVSYSIFDIPEYTAQMDIPTYSYVFLQKPYYAYMGNPAYDYTIIDPTANFNVGSDVTATMPITSATYNLEHI